MSPRRVWIRSRAAVLVRTLLLRRHAVVATPYLDEAERCSRIALMYEARFSSVTPANVSGRATVGSLPARAARPTESIPKAQRRFTEVVSDVQRFGDRLDVLSQQAGHSRNPAHLGAATNSDPRFCHRYPNSRNTFVAPCGKLKATVLGQLPRIYPKNNRMERRLARKISVKYSVTFAPSIK